VQATARANCCRRTCLQLGTPCFDSTDFRPPAADGSGAQDVARRRKVGRWLPLHMSRVGARADDDGEPQVPALHCRALLRVA
jgi:hypothetical protein